MKLVATYKRALIDPESGGVEVTLSCPSAAVAKLNRLIDKQLSVEIKPIKAPRSLEANAYMWSLLGDIATALETDSDSVYEQMLERYGSYENLPIWKPALQNERKKHRLCVENGETVLTDKNGNEQTFVWCKCYRGSSEYDTGEMSRLIDGVVSEAQELDIETRTPEQLAELKSLWKNAEDK